MDRRTRSLFALVLVLLIAVTGAAAIALSGGTADGVPQDAPSVTGVVVGVDSAGLDKVRGFTLRTVDGATMDFTLGGLTNGVTFAPGHLVEHQATAQPIQVWYRIDGEARVAIRLEDAP